MAEVDLKTLTPANGDGTDYIIATDSAQIGVKALNNVVTTTGTQALTNKTLTSPTISGAVTLSSPTLTSPTMTAPVLGTVDSGDITACTGSPTLTTIELGAGATDTTIARSGAGAVTVEGSQVIIANTTVYRSAYIRAQDMITCNASSAASVTGIINSRIGYDGWAFDPATAEYIGFWYNFGPKWDAGTVKARFYWTEIAATGTPTEVVVWGIGGVSFADESGISSTVPATATVVQDVLVTTYSLHKSAAVTCTITNAAAGDATFFEVVRSAAAAEDTMNGEDAILLGVELEYSETTAVATSI